MLKRIDLDNIRQYPACRFILIPADDHEGCFFTIGEVPWNHPQHFIIFRVMIIVVPLKINICKYPEGAVGKPDLFQIVSPVAVIAQNFCPLPRKKFPGIKTITRFNGIRTNRSAMKIFACFEPWDELLRYRVKTVNGITGSVFFNPGS